MTVVTRPLFAAHQPGYRPTSLISLCRPLSNQLANYEPIVSRLAHFYDFYLPNLCSTDTRLGQSRRRSYDIQKYTGITSIPSDYVLALQASTAEVASQHLVSRLCSSRSSSTVANLSVQRLLMPSPASYSRLNSIHTSPPNSPHTSPLNGLYSPVPHDSPSLERYHPSPHRVS